MKYIPFNINQNTVSLAKDVARLLYYLSRPVPHADDVTKYWWRFLIHQDGTKAAFSYDETVQIPIDSRADAQLIYDVIYWDVNLTPTQKQNIKDFLIENQSATVEQILRNTWVANAVTLADLKAAGWFPEDTSGV